MQKLKQTFWATQYYTEAYRKSWISGAFPYVFSDHMYLSTIAFSPSCYIVVPLFFSFFFFWCLPNSPYYGCAIIFNSCQGVDFSVGSDFSLFVNNVKITSSYIPPLPTCRGCQVADSLYHSMQRLRINRSVWLSQVGGCCPVCRYFQIGVPIHRGTQFQVFVLVGTRARLRKTENFFALGLSVLLRGRKSHKVSKLNGNSQSFNSDSL